MFHNALVDGSSPTSSPRRTHLLPHWPPFSGKAQETELFAFECKVFDQVGWSNAPMFHNTLVVSSSPTSSTTQSPLTGDIVAAPAGMRKLPRRSRLAG